MSLPVLLPWICGSFSLRTLARRGRQPCLSHPMGWLKEVPLSLHMQHRAASPAEVGKPLRNCIYVITYFCYNICAQLLLQSSPWFSFCRCIAAPWKTHFIITSAALLFSRLSATISCKLEMKPFMSWKAIHRWCVCLDGCGFKCVSCLGALNSLATQENQHCICPPLAPLTGLHHLSAKISSQQ